MSAQQTLGRSFVNIHASVHDASITTTQSWCASGLSSAVLPMTWNQSGINNGGHGNTQSFLRPHRGSSCHDVANTSWCCMREDTCILKEGRAITLSTHFIGSTKTSSSATPSLSGMNSRTSGATAGLWRVSQTPGLLLVIQRGMLCLRASRCY